MLAERLILAIRLSVKKRAPVTFERCLEIIKDIKNKAEIHV